MLGEREQDGSLGDGRQSLQEGDLLCDGVTPTGCDDNCPLDANPLQIDTELDGLGNACDDDDDDDGFSDAAEIAAGSDPLDAASTPTAPCPAVSPCRGHRPRVPPDAGSCAPGCGRGLRSMSAPSVHRLGAPRSRRPRALSRAWRRCRTVIQGRRAVVNGSYQFIFHFQLVTETLFLFHFPCLSVSCL